MTSQGGPDLARVLAVACLLGCASLGFGEGLRHDALPEAVSFPALRSGLGTPRGLAIGLRGNVFVASESLGLVFELNATGELAIAVETPEADSVLPSSASGLGDGPSARSVRLGAPMGLAVDASGHLYIADRTAQLVRRLDSATGVLTTVAGAGGGGSSQDGIPATSARLLAPVAVVLDTTGHLYFADAGNHCIRRVDAGTGFISTVAGDGVPGFRGDGGPATEAQLDSPYGLAFDKAGDLYVADRGNHRVRRIKLRTGAIATVAGRGVPGLAGDGGPALAAELNEPTGLGFDHRGRLLIVDSGNSRLRRVTASGRIETVKGTETGLLQPFAVARDRHGRLFVTDAGRRLLLRVEGRGRPTTMAGNGGAGFCGDGGPARNAKLSDVRGLAVGPNGDLYLADADHHRIRRIDGATGLITTVAGDGRPGFDGDGGPAGQASLRHPSGVALEGAGRLLIADSGNHRVRRVSADGLIATIAGSGVRGVDGEGTAALDAALDTPWSIAVDTLGDVLFSQARNGCVRSVDSRSGVLTTVAGNPFTRHPALDGEPARAGSLGTSVGGLAIDERGNVFVAEQASRRVRRVDATSGLLSTVAGGGEELPKEEPARATEVALGDVLSLAFDRDGCLLIGDMSFNRVWRLDLASGLMSTLAGGGDQVPMAEGPARGVRLFVRSLAVDREGNVLIGEVGFLRRLDLEGRLTTLAGGGPGF